MPTEARGNYLPDAPYLRETKTYLNYIHASESTLDSGTSGTASHSSRHDMLAIVISSRYQYGPFLFFVAEVMSNYLTTDGLRNFLYFRKPLRPVAFATSATWLIRHWPHPRHAVVKLLNTSWWISIGAKPGRGEARARRAESKGGVPTTDLGLKKLWNFEARACIGLQKILDFINKNVRLVIRTPFQKLRYYFCCINVLKNTLMFYCNS